MFFEYPCKMLWVFETETIGSLRYGFSVQQEPLCLLHEKTADV